MGEWVGLACAAPFLLLALGAAVHCFADLFEDALWPRGLRWFVPAWQALEDALQRAVLRVFWPEKRLQLRPRRLRELEALDSAYRMWALDGRTPSWIPDASGRSGRWMPSRGVCPCGYVQECALWCGDGHTTGRCPAGHEGRAAWPGS